MQTLGVIRIQLIYSINVLSKYSSLISHRPSIFEGRHIDHRRSTHRSPKVDTSIFEGRHNDLRRSTHRSSKVDTSWHRSSIFERRYIDLRKLPHRFSKIEGRNITPTIRHRILSTTALQVLRVDEVTHTQTCIIESVDSISKDERGFPLTQYITNGRISRGGYTFTHFKHHHRVLRLISYRMGV